MFVIRNVSSRVASSRASRIAVACALALTTANCGGGGGTGPQPLAPATLAPVSTATPSASASATPAAKATGAATATAVPSPATSAAATTAPSPAASGAATAIPASYVPFPPTPDSDAFYAQPSSFPNAAPGTVLASRATTYVVAGVSQPNTAYQLKFVSRDQNENPIAAVATVVLPLTAVSATTPILSIQFAEDSLGLKCSPSHNVTGSTTDATSQAENAQGPTALAAGWVVVFPDHEGPNADYAAGRLAGQITLDGVRAAEHFPSTGLSVANPVGLSGYSGGAIATAWAASIEHAYAPELDVVAIASGGTPADVVGIVKNIDSNTVSNAAFFSLIFSAILGVNRAYPQIVTSLLNAKGVAAATALEDGCLGMNSDGSAGPTGMTSDFTTVADPIDSPQVQAAVPLISLPLANNSPTTDVLLYHSQVDELIPIAGADALDAAWCAAGSHVAYYRGVSGDHVAFDASQIPSVMAYFTSRFEALPTVTPVGSTTCN